MAVISFPQCFGIPADVLRFCDDPGNGVNGGTDQFYGVA